MDTINKNRKPYISVVATTRNDNHGGDLLRRTTAFVESIYYQALRTNIEVELIIVEWNPPKDKPLLNEVLPKPNEGITVTLKYVIVPRSIHREYKTSSVIPLYQMIAKNVGIRRASSDFILCTNIDILFSNESFDFIAKNKLSRGVFYRANRCDIPKDVLEIKDQQEMLKYASNNILKRLGKIRNLEVLHIKRLNHIFFPFLKLFNDGLLFAWKVTHPKRKAHFKLDFDACGDFTLMHKSDWENIKGYPELDMYSIHIDSMGIWAAYAIGMKQEVLPYNAPIYHIDHDDGWESIDVVKTIRFLEKKPSLDFSIVHKGGLQLIENKESWKINNDNWGLKNKELEEIIFN